MKNLSFKKKLLVAFLVIIIFFVLLECGLKVFNIGNAYYINNIEFQNTEKIFVNDPDNHNYLVSNPDIEGLISSRFKKVKNENDFRIILLGGSNVYSLPQDDLISYLNEHKEHHSHITYELINAAINDYGSKKLSLLVDEILQYEPDMLFIYMGHNEFRDLVIPRNSFKINPLENSFEDKYLSKLNIWNLIKSLAIYLEKPCIAKNEKYFYTKKDHPSQMEQKLERLDAEVYDQFYKNLKKIVNQARKHGVYVILSTVVSNEVRDPDYSYYPDSLLEGERSFIDKLVASGDRILGDRIDFLKNNGWTDSNLYPHKLNEEGIDKVFPIFYDSLSLNEFTRGFVQNYKKLNLSTGERKVWEEALVKYELAYDVNPEIAKVNYKIGLVNYVLGNDEKALKFFHKAMISDKFPLRATPQINNIIRRVAKEEHVDKFYDFEALFRESANRNIYDFSVVYDGRNLLLTYKDKIIEKLRQLIIDYNNINNSGSQN